MLILTFNKNQYKNHTSYSVKVNVLCRSMCNCPCLCCYLLIIKHTKKFEMSKTIILFKVLLKPKICYKVVSLLKPLTLNYRISLPSDSLYFMYKLNNYKIIIAVKTYQNLIVYLKNCKKLLSSNSIVLKKPLSMVKLKIKIKKKYVYHY